MEAKRIGDLEIQQDLAYQRCEWCFERFGWTVMLLILLAALLGLFGGGFLSHATATNGDGTVHLEYDRFLRFHSESRMRIELAGSLTSQEEVRLWFNREFCERVQFLRITPEVRWGEAGADRQVLVIRVADRGQPLRIYIHFDPDRIGSVAGRLHVAGADPVEFTQFTYP